MALLGLLAVVAACSVDDVRFSSRDAGADAGADASAPMHRATVRLDGSGSGRVVAAGGLDCPGACSALQPHGSTLMLIASAEAGSDFVGWSADGGQTCGSSSECALTMTAPLSITATFTRRQTLDVRRMGSGVGAVASSPAGIDCGADCSETYESGRVVTLTAAAAAGSTFTGWEGGGCTGTGPCSVTVDVAMMVSATFTRNLYTLEVSKRGFGSGMVTSAPAGISCGISCDASYPHGTDVALTAAPSSESFFTGWGGACAGTGPCVVSMMEARSVTATFVQRNPIVSVFKMGSGSGDIFSTPAAINCNPTCSAPVPYGTRLTLTAVPATGSTFYRWSEPSCTGNRSCTFTVVDDFEIGAYFSQNFYTLDVSKRGLGSGTVTSSEGGIDCGPVCSASFPHRYDALLTATPASGSIFAGWGGACTGTDTGCVVSMLGARSVTATFVPISSASSGGR